MKDLRQKINKNKGGLYALIYTLVGVSFSFFLLIIVAKYSSTMGLFFLFLPEFTNDLCFKIGLVALLVLSYLLGNRASYEILVKHRNKYLITYVYGIISILTSSIIYNIVRLLIYGNEFDLNAILVFFGRPILIGLLFGLPSIILFGTMFARQIAKLKTD